MDIILMLHESMLNKVSIIYLFMAVGQETCYSLCCHDENKCILVAVGIIKIT